MVSFVGFIICVVGKNFSLQSQVCKNSPILHSFGWWYFACFFSIFFFKLDWIQSWEVGEGVWWTVHCRHSSPMFMHCFPAPQGDEAGESVLGWESQQPLTWDLNTPQRQLWVYNMQQADFLSFSFPIKVCCSPTRLWNPSSSPMVFTLKTVHSPPKELVERGSWTPPSEILLLEVEVGWGLLTHFQQFPGPPKDQLPATLALSTTKGGRTQEQLLFSTLQNFWGQETPNPALVWTGCGVVWAWKGEQTDLCFKVNITSLELWNWVPLIKHHWSDVLSSKGYIQSVK